MKHPVGRSKNEPPSCSAPAESDQPFIAILIRILGPRKWEYVGLVFLTMFTAAVEGVFHPLLLKAIFDDGVLRGNFRRFCLLIAAYLGIGVILIVTSALASIWAKAFENRIVSSVGRMALESYYGKDYAEVLQRGEGYYVTHVYSDIREGLIPLLTLGQELAAQAILLVASLVILVYLCWKPFLLTAILIPLGTVVATRISKRIRGRAADERHQEGIVVALLSKALNSHRMVNGFGLIGKTADAFQDRMGSLLTIGYKKHKEVRLFQAVSELTIVFSDSVSMFVGALFVLSGRLSFGGYLAFVNTFWRAGSALTQTARRIGDYRSWEVMVRRIATFIQSRTRASRLVDTSVVLSNLAIGYNNDTPVAQDISIVLAPGERVVIVGANGSGKTTLANVLAGHLSQLSGDLASPREISAVTMPIAFPPLAVRELVRDAYILKQLGLDNPSLVDSYADELSTGQQQKVAIAMALSKQADLYIFDEPLAGLDRESHECAINLILSRVKGKTLIVIMHGFEEYHGRFDRVLEFDQLQSVGV